MCGIVGYVGGGAVSEVLLAGLKNLEYRGYDSAGIALNDNGRIDVFKAPGKLGNLCAAAAGKADKLPATGGIGHIRWATHGKATVENAHPHLSNDGRLALVHNGIIENYKSLREELEQEGYVFSSETDTEAAVHLFEREYKKSGSLEVAVTAGVRRLKGAFAFCVMHQNEPDKIIAVRQNAPLIVGLGKDENYVASDIPAIVGKVRRIIYLNDGEIAVITRKEAKIYDFDGCPIERQPEYIGFNPEVISKRGYPHFMLKEINEQPDIVRHLLQDAYAGGRETPLLPKVNIAAAAKAERIEIIACGTSLHAAAVAGFAFEEWLKIPVSVVAASEYIYRSCLTDEKTLTIGISQSGETADTITAVKRAEERGAHILVLTNREDSSIVRHAGSLLPLKAGIEVSVAATKSYTAQLTCLYLLGLALASARGSLPPAELGKLRDELRQLPAKMEKALSEDGKVKAAAERLKDYRQMIYIARGVNLPTAQEGALKLKEISYVNANGYPAGELKHGPIALLDENMPVTAVLAPGGRVYDKMISNCEEARARHAFLTGVSFDGDKRAEELFDLLLTVPSTAEIFSPLLLNLPLQLLAYHIADLLGREVDQPRNLAKSVTVE